MKEGNTELKLGIGKARIRSGAKELRGLRGVLRGTQAVATVNALRDICQGSAKQGRRAVEKASTEVVLCESVALLGCHSIISHCLGIVL